MYMLYVCVCVCVCVYVYIYIYIYRVYKKKVDKSEIAFCFATRLNIRCFFIKRDCFGTYNLE